MSTPKHHIKVLLATAVASLLLAGCAQTPVPEGSADVRNKLARLQANQELASRAPVAIKDAEEAVRAAEVPERDLAIARHRVLLADRKVDIAAARAQARLYEDERAGLSKDSESARLDSRTREADRAHLEANLARDDADAARLKAEDLKRQLDELKAKETERGIVITLGDVLFATGRAELTGGAASRLGKLAVFLNEYPDRTIVIEGHTDSVGSDDANYSLSQRRAESVRGFLANLGVVSTRLRTTGLGEGSPVASNDTDTGRQQNRRVEVIIENMVQTAK
jgi:outer membrane protein OmpA-like peptidoglycan-associated protein